MVLSTRSRFRPIVLISLLVSVVLLFAAWTEATRPVLGPHSRLDLARFDRSSDTLEWVVGAYFTTSGRCKGCHGHDIQGLASVDAQGNDVNLVDDWRSTMMANSARDPFFKAKVSHEVLVNPGHQGAIENKCLSCHAPLGMHEERMLGNPPFTMAMLDTSKLGNDGASCLGCHMQAPGPSGTVFSGDLVFEPAHVYGPYFDDQINPAIMQFFVDFTPGYGEHIVNSEVCAGCHTLITETLDLEGNITGDQFVEQATYHEWKNSIYSVNGTQCNTCHMPRINDPIILAAEYAFLNPQTPFGKHHFAGANVHMLELLKANRDILDLRATEVQFDSTIARTKRMLQDRTLNVQLSFVDRTSDSIFYSLQLENLAGHRFPSGFPSRRAFIEFVVLDAEGDTVFKSGRTDSNYEVEGHNAGYEPHYDMINRTDQVQIYEMVMGDVFGNVTTVLERAKAPIKDNRLVPLGFSMAHPSYDTTLIAGAALLDNNFNHDSNGLEGSGTDRLEYHVALNGNTSALRAFATIYYQPVPPAWNTEMFSHTSTEIDSFRDLLDASDGTPTFVAMDSLSVGTVGMGEHLRDRISLFPNPALNGSVRVVANRGDLIEVIGVNAADGRAVSVQRTSVASGLVLQLPDVPGVYFLTIRINGSVILERVVRP